MSSVPVNLRANRTKCERHLRKRASCNRVVHCDDDLALRAPLFHIRHGFERVREWERAVEHRAQRARIKDRELN
jgi:hypothetical protein